MKPVGVWEADWSGSTPGSGPRSPNFAGRSTPNAAADALRASRSGFDWSGDMTHDGAAAYDRSSSWHDTFQCVFHVLHRVATTWGKSRPAGPRRFRVRSSPCSRRRWRCDQFLAGVIFRRGAGPVARRHRSLRRGPSSPCRWRRVKRRRRALGQAHLYFITASRCAEAFLEDLEHPGDQPLGRAGRSSTPIVNRTRITWGGNLHGGRGDGSAVRAAIDLGHVQVSAGRLLFLGIPARPASLPGLLEQAVHLGNAGTRTHNQADPRPWSQLHHAERLPSP